MLVIPTSTTVLCVTQVHLVQNPALSVLYIFNTALLLYTYYYYPLGSSIHCTATEQRDNAITAYRCTGRPPICSRSSLVLLYVPYNDTQVF